MKGNQYPGAGRVLAPAGDEALGPGSGGGLSLACFAWEAGGIAKEGGAAGPAKSNAAGSAMPPCSQTGGGVFRGRRSTLSTRNPSMSMISTTYPWSRKDSPSAGTWPT